MCGINGFTLDPSATRGARDLIEQMNAVTRHRGPDATGVFVSEGISLGNNRLKIIDLSDAAAQPMKSHDGRYVIVFNGEIYNYRELKKEFPGYPFRTESDTEVILAAYEGWGKECVKRFRGIFAFAVWDTKRRELFIARDQSGIKPLYYTRSGTQFIFSSEIKAILEHEVPRKLHVEAFKKYLRVVYVPGPHTMFEGIHKFPPAHYGVVKNGTLALTAYFDIAHTPRRSASYASFRGEVRRNVKAAVKEELVSDRPVGVFLSGGIDSSVVLSAMADVRGNIDTFSVGYELQPGEEPEKFNADFLLARNTAAFYGTNHHEVLVSPNDVVKLFPGLVHHLDEPISNPTGLAMMKLSQFTKGNEDVAVVLTGNGGDELFGGYPRYRLSRIADLYQLLMPSFVRGLLSRDDRFRKLNTPRGIDRYELFFFQKDQTLLEAARGDLADDSAKRFFKDTYFNKPADDFTAHFMDVDRKTWLVDESFTLLDKTTMSAGLEARVPLVNLQVLRHALTIPTRYKVTPWDTKIILKDAFRDALPPALFTQPKRGWISPAAKWLRYPEVHEFVQEVLSPAYYPPIAPLFKWEAIAQIVRDHYERRKYNRVIIWALLTFCAWAREYRVTL